MVKYEFWNASVLHGEITHIGGRTVLVLDITATNDLIYSIGMKVVFLVYLRGQFTFEEKAQMSLFQRNILLCIFSASRFQNDRKEAQFAVRFACRRLLGGTSTNTGFQTYIGLESLLNYCTEQFKTGLCKQFPKNSYTRLKNNHKILQFSQEDIRSMAFKQPFLYSFCAKHSEIHKTLYACCQWFQIVVSVLISFSLYNCCHSPFKLGLCMCLNNLLLIEITVHLCPVILIDDLFCNEGMSKLYF